MDRRTFKSKLQYLILKGLEFKATRRPIKGSIEIKKAVFDHLIELGIGKTRFAPQPDFAREFVLKSIMECGDFYFIDPDTFLCKLISQNTIVANGREFKSGHFGFSFKFRANFDKGE